MKWLSKRLSQKVKSPSVIYWLSVVTPFALKMPNVSTYTSREYGNDFSVNNLILSLACLSTNTSNFCSASVSLYRASGTTNSLRTENSVYYGDIGHICHCVVMY